jgi:hypothetical protein
MTIADRTVDVLANDIRGISLKIARAQERRDKLQTSKVAFEQYFGSNSGKYAALGLLCFSAMVFDLYVNSVTLKMLAGLLKTPSWLLAVMITFIDGFLAVQASGLLEVSSDVLRSRSKSRWSTILWLIAIAKIIFYVTYVFAAIPSVGLDDVAIQAIVTLIIPQVLFIFIIYSILHFSGAGLWYYCGHIWYAFLNSTISNVNTLISKRDGHVADLKAHCKTVDIDLSSVESQYKINLG